jgi:hypothetical protein
VVTTGSKEAQVSSPKRPQAGNIAEGGPEFESPHPWLPRAGCPLPPRQAATAQPSPALAAPVAHGLPAGWFAVAARLLPDELMPDD